MINLAIGFAAGFALAHPAVRAWVLAKLQAIKAKVK